MKSGASLRFLTTTTTGETVHVALPDGASRLVPTTPSEAAPAARIAPPESAGDGAVLEVLRTGSRPKVLVSRPGGADLRLNGLPLPLLAVMGLGDELRLPNHMALHLSVWCEPRIGPAPEERRADECPVCRTPLATGETYLCTCGHYLHMNGKEVPSPERLECARSVPHCPSCREAIRLTAGYLYEPEA